MPISENDWGHRTFFVISNFQLPLPRSTITSFCLERVSLHSETTEKHVFPRLALSLTCITTLRLSVGDCLQDTVMLEPGILHIRVAAHFGFHRDTVPDLWKHNNAFFIAWVLTILSSACDVKGVQRLYIPRPHTRAAASKLLVPYFEAFPGYVQSVDSMPALVRIMAWCRSGDTPLSEQMTVWVTDVLT